MKIVANILIFIVYIIGFIWLAY